MTIHLSRVSRMAVIAVAGFLGPPAAWAQNRGTPADQDACTPDVFRLCSDLIPDEAAITACLESKRKELSPPCSKVFGPAPASSTRHRRQR